MIGYPVVLTSLGERRCVVVGGGAVAARKVRSLIAVGARPVVISPMFCAELEALSEAGSISPIRRPYRPGDLEGAALVIAATGERAVNSAISHEAQRLGAPVNVVDDPALCTFIVPAILRRGDLTIAISTGGESPALARHLREMLENVLDPAYGDLLAVLAALRPRLRQQLSPEAQRRMWDRLLDGELLACVRTGGMEAARARAAEILEAK